MKICFRCKKEVHIDDKVGFRDICPSCGIDLHCCKNCSFHETGAYNQCRENQAERVIEKERNNFCDFFVYGTPGQGSQGKKKDMGKKLDALLKK